MRQAILIVNRAAGGLAPDRLLAALDARFEREGVHVETTFTAAPGDATRLAREAAADGVDAVFALGGDGTLREAAEGLLGTGVPLGPLPGGTANVLRLALGLPRDPLAAAERVCRLEPRQLDVGLVRSGSGDTSRERVFLMMASAGLDARVLARLSTAGKRRFGRGHILTRGLAEWWGYDYPGLTVEVDGETYRASFAAVSNIPHYGGPFRLAPSARTDDRSLHLLLFRGTGRAATLGFAWSVLTSRHVRRRDVTVLPIRRAVFRGPDSAPERLDLQVDGDPVPDPAPVTVLLAPEPLPILAPLAC